MPTIDPRIDAYIAASAGFAQPVLKHLRAIVHEACPEVEETVKWGFPHFQYKGMLCSMASFKAHCTFGFWKSSLLLEAEDNKSRDAMGSFGRIETVKDLPSKRALVGYIRKAMALNEADIKPAKVKAAPRETVLPEDFAAALQGQARTRFDAFTPSQQREYIDWLNDAKTEATRLRRMAQAVQWIAEGKKRNWKYENC